MGRLEREARDKRVEQQKKRQTVYTVEYQTYFVNYIKEPIFENLAIVVSPVSSRAEKFKALIHIRRISEDFTRNIPEPTKENTWHPNSHRLIEWRDEFFRHCYLEHVRLRYLRLIINFVIIIYDYDPPYRMMIDWWAKQMKIQNWNYDVPVTINAHNWQWWKE